MSPSTIATSAPDGLADSRQLDYLIAGPRGLVPAAMRTPAGTGIIAAAAIVVIAPIVALVIFLAFAAAHDA
jgi:hypothetical protein